MWSPRSALLVLTVVVSGTHAVVQTPPSPTTVRVRGTIQEYDSRTRTLTLRTFKGPVRFALASLARIRRDGQAVDASTLQTLIGYAAAVRYSESAGHRTVESVHVFGTSQRKE